MMDKEEALRQINLTIEQVKCLPAFTDKPKLLRYMCGLKDFVVLHKPYGNHNELCAREAQAMFDQKRSQLEAIKEGIS